MINTKRVFIALITLLALTGCMNTSPNPENSLASVHSDTLENGLSYNIYAKQDSSQKVQLRLYVNAGSLSETEEQQGYAHLLEHMAFNGTKNFPKNKIIELFEKSGLTFGQDINAFTSFSETVYILSIPANDKKLLSETLLYLRDILSDIEFDQTELIKEQGVVQNEYRVRMPQEPPYHFAIFEDYIADSVYQKHLPIGTIESVGNSTEKAVKAFYKQWYRPNNAKLLITGDVDSQLTQKLIEETFSSIDKSDNQQQQTVPDAPRMSEESIAFSSKLITFSQTDLFFEIPQKTLSNSDQLSEALKLEMLDKMLNYRLNILNSERDAPFSEVSFSYLPLLNNKSFKNLSVNYEQGNDINSIAFIAQELARLAQHGFNQAEYELQLEALQAQLAQLKANYLNQTAAEIAQQVVGAWQTGDHIFTFEQEQQAYQTALDSLTLEEINQLAQQLINLPKKLTLAYPYGSDQPDLSMVDKTFNEHFNAQVANTTIKIEKMTLPVIIKSTAISPIKKEKFYPEKQITQLSLHNGVDVLLQPDSSVQDAITLTFSAPGGSNSLQGKEIASSTLLINSYANSGLAGLSAQALNQKFISAKTEIMPFIDSNHHGFSMTTVNKDKSLQLLFSMLYTIMNDATIKPAVFTQEKKKLIENQKSFLAQPMNGSTIKVLNTLFPANPHQHIFTLEELASVQQSDVEALYTQLFSSSNGYKLTVVGDFDLDAMKTLVLQYVATLAGGELHTFDTTPQSLIQQASTINETTNPQDNASVSFISITNNPNKDIKAVYQADLMRRIITQTLNRVIREEFSLTYSPYVAVYDQQTGNAFTQVIIQATTKTDDAQKTQHLIEGIINDFITDGITPEQLADHQRGLIQGMLSNLNKSTDRQWLLHRDHLQGFELDSTTNAKEIVHNISLTDMNQFIKEYLDPSKTVKIINQPK
ncbi:insulinase family protein [Psychromonas sp. psych-6C06]|uniref:M16 family metallopeptidase n=1 Tax=Psychromonas sp. psych-6C06 TaxID=2058089 RepID=UPI000C348FC6|nr:M16 family metallopeptidase [Psychromonas sp. psych-6C06]PKF60530.1 insulinase family protein [Psychromonas sp. psych-6C06]